MKISTFRFDPSSGWDLDRFSNNDSENTFAIVFGATELMDEPCPIIELASELPSSGLLSPLHHDRDDKKRLVRTVLAVDDETESLTFRGDIPQNHLA